ncbi:transposon Ty3-I Gag-Pol polyprotein [Trichonephila clavipes]|nr:transposon Ty3-I Gag-Pol polyprotein [Trichonephila clavipes]
MLSRPVTQEEESFCEENNITIADMPTRSCKDMREAQLKDDNLKKIIDSFESPLKTEEYANWTERGFLMNQGVLYRYVPDADSAEAKNVQNVLALRLQTRKPAGLLRTPVYTQRFKVIAIDLFGPLPQTGTGKLWIFIVEDCATKWVELFALSQASARQYATTLIEEVFICHGIPRRIISDNGMQFVIAVLQQICFTLNISQNFIPVYSPQSNPVERKNRDLKPRLAILVGDDHSSWYSKLPVIRFAMNTTVCDTTDIRERIETKQDQRKKQYDKNRRPVYYSPGDKVWVTLHPISNAKNKKTFKFMPKRDGPYLILTQKSPTSYVIASLANPSEPIATYHTSALTPVKDINTSPIDPLRKRGRPRKVTSKSQNKDVPSPSTATKAVFNRTIHPSTRATTTTTNYDSSPGRTSEKFNLIDLIPKYDGSESLGICRFLEKINGVANLGKWSNAEKVTILKLKLVGIAEEFFLSDPTHSNLTEFNDIARALISRFERTVPLFTRLQIFSSCIQGSSESVQEFAARINKLGTQIFQSSNTAQKTAARNANDQLLQSRFISSLRNDIRRFFLVRDPNNLEESINVELIEEQNVKLNQIANDKRTGLSPLRTETSVISALTNKLEEINLRVKRLQEASSVTARKTGFLSNKNPSTKILRWKLALEEFNYDKTYIRGSLNSVADHLSSCINNITIALPESKDLIKMQHEDPVLNPIIQKIDQNDVSSQISNYFINGEGLLCHLSKRPSRSSRSNTTRKQVCIPHCLKAKILESVHSEYGGHLKFFKTYHRLSENFFWHNMYKDTKNFVRSCTICLSRKNAFKIPPAPHQVLNQEKRVIWIFSVP